MPLLHKGRQKRKKHMIQNTQSETGADMTVLIMQALLVLRGYSVELSGRGDGKTLEALRDYMKSMEEK